MAHQSTRFRGEFLAAHRRSRGRRVTAVTDVPPLLAELLLAHGASGHEDDVQAIVRREAAAIGAEISTDVLGTTIATVAGHDRRAHRGAVRPRRSGRDGGARRGRGRAPHDRPARRLAARRRGAAARPDRDSGGRGSRGRRPAGGGRDHVGQPAHRHRRVRPRRRLRARSPGRPDRARRAARVAPERAGAVDGARRPGRDLLRPRDPPAPRRRPGGLGLRPRRHRAGGNRHARRSARRCAAARSGRRDHPRGDLCRRCAGAAPWGAGRAPRRRSDRLPRPGRQPCRHARACSPSPPTAGITVAIETGKVDALGRRRHLHGRCRRRLRHRLAFRSATCTRPARSCSSPTWTMPLG